MHRTAAGDRRHPSRRKPVSWPVMPAPCRRPPVHPRPPGSAKAARRGGDGPGRGRGPQAAGQVGGPDRVVDGKGQAEPEWLQDLHLLDGILARGRRDAQCASGKQQDDGWRDGQTEGQSDEGGGAWDAGPSCLDRLTGHNLRGLVG